MHRSAHHSRGMVLIYSVILLSMLVGLATFAVDYGRMQIVKSELQAGIDSAAMAAARAMASAASGHESAVASTEAIRVAALNNANYLPIAIASADVQVGNWDTTKTPNFSSARTPLNAVQVNGHCDAAHGTAVKLSVGPVIGISTCDVRTSSIALMVPPASPYGFTGINSASFGSIGVLARVTGNIVSNGDISVGNPLGVLVTVSQNAQSYAGFVSAGPLASISGSTTPLTQPLNYPPVRLPASCNNAAIASDLDSSNNFIATGYVSIPAGTYIVHNLNLLLGLNLQLQGPVTFYVTGAFNMAVNANLLGSSTFTPSSFIVRVIKGGTVNFTGDLLSPVCMEVYAPQSDIAINVTVSQFTGSLIGKTLSVNVPLASRFTEVVMPAQQPDSDLVQ